MAAQEGAAAWGVLCTSLPVPSFGAALLSACGSQGCLRAELQAVRAPLNSRPTGRRQHPALSFDPC